MPPSNRPTTFHAWRRARTLARLECRWSPPDPQPPPRRTDAGARSPRSARNWPRSAPLDRTAAPYPKRAKARGWTFDAARPGVEGQPRSPGSTRRPRALQRARAPTRSSTPAATPDAPAIDAAGVWRRDSPSETAHVGHRRREVPRGPARASRRPASAIRKLRLRRRSW